MIPRGILDGADRSGGAEDLTTHHARLGPLPDHRDLIEALTASELRGRGGAGFPTAVKWQAVAERSKGKGVVLANGAEGEPLSHKDRTLMETRPHLVLDGAELAARAVGARRIVIYVGSEHRRALLVMRTAMAERAWPKGIEVSLVEAPPRYVAGEETAAIRRVNAGVALPATKPPRAFERGVDGRPTLVQNVETLAHSALIARFGPEWFRSLGRDGSSGSILLTVSGAVANRGVLEVSQGTSLAETVSRAGGDLGRSPGVLLGGYFGSWVTASEAKGLVLDAGRLRAAGRSLGCGVISVPAPGSCGVAETAGIVRYLADESASQCGPCVFGLRAISEALDRVASGSGNEDDVARLARWSRELPGRGACGHPDGAAGLVRSALVVFEEDFALHARERACALAA